MSSLKKSCSFCLVALFLSATSVFCAESGLPRFKGLAVKSVKYRGYNTEPGLTKLEKRDVVIGGKTLKVNMSVRVYTCEFSYQARGKTFERSKELYCYEVYTTAPGEDRLSWSVWVWPMLPPGEFFIVSGKDKTPYLAWIESIDILFVEISKPIDRIEFLLDFLATSTGYVVRVPVFNLVDDREYRGRGRHAEIEVLDIEKKGEDALRVSAFFRPGKKTIHFEYDGKEWRKL